MSLTHEETIRVAHLARIRIDLEKVEALTQDLNGIFSWIDQLQEADVSGIFLHDDVVVPQMHERQDVVTAVHLPVLDNAPQAEHGFFVVPKVVE